MKPLRYRVCEDGFLRLVLDKICPGALIKTEQLNYLVYEWYASHLSRCCLRSKLFIKVPNKEAASTVIFLHLLL